MFVKAIFDEPKERTNWPSSQRKFGTQLGQQLQDGTVCALHVSCCKFGLVVSRIAELPVQYSSRPTTAWELKSH